MQAIVSYFRRLFADPVFFRICMFLWGVPFLLLGCYAMFSWRPVETYEWFGVALLFAIACGGALLIFVSTRGSNEAVEKASNYMHEGGDVFGAILALLVCLVAVPIAAVIRASQSSSEAE
jgi:hypothetical protein